MANYESFKESKIEIRESFNKFFKTVFKMETILCQVLNGKTPMTEEQKSEIYRLENKCNYLELFIQDECCWAISKNHPIGEGLRVFLSLLYSIKELERMGDHMKSACDYLFYHPKLPKEIIKLLKKAVSNTQEITSKVYEIIQNKMTLQSYDSMMKLEVERQKSFSSLMIEFTKAIKQLDLEENHKLFTSTTIALRHIDRSAVCAINIYENFLFVKKPDCFVEKRNLPV